MARASIDETGNLMAQGIYRGALNVARTALEQERVPSARGLTL